MNKKSIISSLLLSAFSTYICFFQMYKKTYTVPKDTPYTSKSDAHKSDEQANKYSFEMTLILSDTPSYKLFNHLLYTFFKKREKFVYLEPHTIVFLKKDENIYSFFLDILFSCIISAKAP